MILLKLSAVALLLLLVSSNVFGIEQESDELSDFEFEEMEPESSQDYVYTDANSEDLRRMDMEELELIEPNQNSLIAKEKKLRLALNKALTNKATMRKFAEVLPILRVLSKDQRVAMAAIITAQAGAATGDELKLKDIEAAFGDKKKLILPVLLDIANLIRSSVLAVAAQSSANSNHLYKEKESPISIQQLRRNFPRAMVDFIMDDRMQVEDKEGHVVNRTKDVKNKDHQNRIKRSLHYQPQPQPYHHNIHRRKLNIDSIDTAGLDENLTNQTIPVTLTRIESPYSPSNGTLEEIEHLALSDLNGTVSYPTKSLHNQNREEDESLPTPEKLISSSRYRSKRPHQRKPQLIQEGLRNCERFTGTLCLHVNDYPMQQIMGSIRRNKHAMSALLAEYADKRAELDLEEYVEEVKYNKKRREDDDEGTSMPGGMCPSIVRYARPQKARSASGEWKYIVNTGQHTQTLRLEKCSKPQETCTYLTDNFRSRCVQVYNYHRLLSWDNVRGLHVDIFKVPTCCSCHIDGYRESYPPLNSYHGHDIGDDFRFSASNVRNTHYSTINNPSSNSDEDDEDEEESSVAYQYSNGFKRNPSKPFKLETPSILLQNPSSSKTRYDKKKLPALSSFLPTTGIGSYLAPPSDFDVTSTFKRSPSSAIKRTRRPPPVRINTRDQSFDGSELLPEYTSFPNIDITADHVRKRISTVGTTLLPYTPSTITTQQHHTTKNLLTNSGSTASQRDDDGKRVNYNYHPILDFFENQRDGTAERLVGARKPANGRDKNSNWTPIANPIN